MRAQEMGAGRLGGRASPVQMEWRGRWARPTVERELARSELEVRAWGAPLEVEGTRQWTIATLPVHRHRSVSVRSAFSKTGSLAPCLRSARQVPAHPSTSTRTEMD